VSSSIVHRTQLRRRRILTFNPQTTEQAHWKYVCVCVQCHRERQPSSAGHEQKQSSSGVNARSCGPRQEQRRRQREQEWGTRRSVSPPTAHRTQLRRRNDLTFDSDHLISLLEILLPLRPRPQEMLAILPLPLSQTPLKEALSPTHHPLTSRRTVLSFPPHLLRLRRTVYSLRQTLPHPPLVVAVRLRPLLCTITTLP
jgi:hypothetical protein